MGFAPRPLGAGGGWPCRCIASLPIHAPPHASLPHNHYPLPSWHASNLVCASATSVWQSQIAMHGFNWCAWLTKRIVSRSGLQRPTHTDDCAARMRITKANLTGYLQEMNRRLTRIPATLSRSAPPSCCPQARSCGAACASPPRAEHQAAGQACCCCCCLARPSAGGA